MDELETFKTAINLTEYAAALGYRMDRQESSRSSVAMRHPNGDKVIVARGEDGHWIYFSVRDDADNGSIIDFVQRRRGCTLGDVRRELRPWVGVTGSAFVRPAAETFTREVSPVTRDRAGMLRAIARMKPLVFHRYLEEERGIPRAVLTGPRFAGKVLVDVRANAVFPHIDQAGPCGFEIKNRNYTAFASGGEKGLWFSAVKSGDERLVFAESAIDALSYHVLHPGERTRYASIGGALNPTQPALIRGAIERMGEGAEIVIATDNDPDGRKLADAIESLARETGRGDLRVSQDLPPQEGQDWNDVLRQRGESAPAGALLNQAESAHDA